jgi:hypothetical protein
MSRCRPFGSLLTLGLLAGGRTLPAWKLAGAFGGLSASFFRLADCTALPSALERLRDCELRDGCTGRPLARDRRNRAGWGAERTAPFGGFAVAAAFARLSRAAASFLSCRSFCAAFCLRAAMTAATPALATALFGGGAAGEEIERGTGGRAAGEESERAWCGPRIRTKKVTKVGKNVSH